MKRRKLTALLVSAALLLTAAWGMGAAASTDVLRGIGSFDTPEDGVPVGWTARHDAEIVEFTSDNGFEVVQGYDPETGTDSTDAGNKAVKICSRGGSKRRSLVTAPIPLAPGATYTLSCMAKFTGGLFGYVTLYPSTETAAWDSTYRIGYDAFVFDTADVWQTHTVTFTMPKDRDLLYMELVYTSGSRATYSMTIDDLTICGVPADGNLMQGEERIENGDFENGSTGWTLSSDALLATEEGNTALTLTSAADTAAVTVPMTGAAAYAVAADVKVTDGVPVIYVDADGENVQTGPFFDRCRDYTLTFNAGDETDTGWKKIYFTLYKATNAAETVLTFAADSGTVIFDNISVRPTRELASNGNFDGLTFTVTPIDLSSLDYLPHGTLLREADYIEDGGYGGSRGLDLGTREGKSQDRRYYFPVPVEAGKTYKVSGKMYSSIPTEPTVYFIGGYEQSGMGSGMYYQAAEIQLNASAAADTWTDFSVLYTVPAEIVDTNEETVDWRSIQEISVAFKDRRAVNPGITYILDDISVQEVGAFFFDENGDLASEVKNGETVYASYLLLSDTSEPQNAVLVLALYEIKESTKQLVGFATAEDTATDTVPAMLYAEMTVPAGEGSYMLSAFVLDGLSSLRALGARADLK